MHKKMNFSVKNFFGKCEHIRIKLRICSHLLNKSFMENFVFCVVNIIGFTTESSKFFCKPNCQSFIYFTSVNTWHRLGSSCLFRNQFLALAVNNNFTQHDLVFDWYSIQLDHCWILYFNKIPHLYLISPSLIFVI